MAAIASGTLSHNFTTESLTGALAGGVLLGFATVAKLKLNGNIFGISGIVSGLLKPTEPNRDDTWRFYFAGGLPLAGIALRAADYDAFEQLPTDSLSLGRLLLAGLLVGVGTSLGNGCTSGHGISGITRFSKRSIVATAIFMGTGVITATSLRTVSWLNSDLSSDSSCSSTTTMPIVTSIATAAAVATAISLLIWLVMLANLSTSNSRRMVEFAASCAAGVGLGISAMTKPIRVACFLDFSGASFANWDPTLGFVMAGALCLTTPCYHLWLKDSKPKWADKISLPSKSELDARLVVGAAVFGAGWGMAGICPGPGLVAFVGVTEWVNLLPWACYLAGMFSGWWLIPRLTRITVGVGQTHDQIPTTTTNSSANP